jgi:glycosyltransferase involved in cell wall biosynthesis
MPHFFVKPAPVTDNPVSQKFSTLHVHARDIRRNDAVGNFARQVARLAANAGWRTRLWAENCDGIAGEEIEPRDRFWQAVNNNDVIFFNFSIYDPVIEKILQVGAKKIMYYHNITPPLLLDDAADVENARLGRSQRPLACGFDAVIANSLVSKRALIEELPSPQRAALEETIVICPPIIGVDRWHDIKAEPIESARAPTTFLYVGRLTRHKGLLELLDAFETMARRIGDLGLTIVGRPGQATYVHALRQRASEISRSSDCPVQIHCNVSDGQLKTLYQSATAFITFTRHEGFCIPIVDAFFFEKPVFVTPAPAVMEVVDNAGFVLPDFHSETAAQSILKLLGRGDWENLHAESRIQRLKSITAKADGTIILDVLREL